MKVISSYFTNIPDGVARGDKTQPTLVNLGHGVSLAKGSVVRSNAEHIKMGEVKSYWK